MRTWAKGKPPFPFEVSEGSASVGYPVSARCARRFRMMQNIWPVCLEARPCALSLGHPDTHRQTLESDMTGIPNPDFTAVVEADSFPKTRTAKSQEDNSVA